MKKYIWLVIPIIILGFLVYAKGFVKESEDAIKFKEEYESFNNKSNDYFDYRNLSIEEDNPIVFSTDEEIVKMIENKESFIVYFGDPECPWCRSMVEELIKTANENKIKKIYYIRFWDGFHNEIIRDTYIIDSKGNAVVKDKGTDAYYKLLEYLDNVLSDYTLKDEKGNTIKTGEKRIFLPNIVAIVDGESKELIEGISSKQESYNDELNDEIIKDERKIFNDFFKKYK